MAYHVGLDFAPTQGSLILFDEADAFIFREPAKFAALIAGCYCVCFTATPDNRDPAGLHRAVTSALGLASYDYVLDADERKALQVDVDAVLELPTAEQQVQYVSQRVA